MLRALAQATQASDRSRRPLWLALAAMVTLVVGVGLWWNARRPPDGTEVMRGPESSIQLISSGRAENNAIRFLWHSAPGARLYRVEITTPGGSLIYGVSTTDTVLSASSVGPLVPGSEYLWWVSATLATGGTIRSSVIPLRLRR